MGSLSTYVEKINIKERTRKYELKKKQKSPSYNEKKKTPAAPTHRRGVMCHRDENNGRKQNKIPASLNYLVVSYEPHV